MTTTKPSVTDAKVAMTAPVSEKHREIALDIVTVNKSLFYPYVELDALAELFATAFATVEADALERAAKWHDEQAERYDGDHRRAYHADYAERMNSLRDEHNESAAATRAMASSGKREGVTETPVTQREADNAPPRRVKMGDLLIFPGETDKPMDPHVLLGKAYDAKLKSVVIVGIQEDGALFLSGSPSHAPDVAIMLDLAKRRLLGLIDPRES